MTGRISRRDIIPLNPILEVEFFYAWGIDFIGPFSSSVGNQYNLVAVDYVSKWVETVPIKTNDYKIAVKFLKESIISRFGAPRAVISDNGSHLYNRAFEALMRKYLITHKLSMVYHPQTNGQVEVTNRQIKLILGNVVGQNRKDWSIKLMDALWAYWTAFKTVLGLSACRVVVGKPSIYQLN